MDINARSRGDTEEDDEDPISDAELDNALDVAMRSSGALSLKRKLNLRLLRASNAFLSVDQPTLWLELLKWGASGPPLVIDWLRMLYSHLSYSSPILWLLFISDFRLHPHPDNVELASAGTRVSNLELADDMMLASQSPTGAQDKLNQSSEYTAETFVLTNVPKTLALMFGPLPDPFPVLSLRDERLESWVASTFRRLTPTSRTLYLAHVEPHLVFGCEFSLDVPPPNVSASQPKAPKFPPPTSPRQPPQPPPWRPAQSLIESLIICESAVAAPARPGANSPVAATLTDSSSLQASIALCTHQEHRGDRQDVHQGGTPVLTGTPCGLCGGATRAAPPATAERHEAPRRIPRASVTPAFTKLTTAQLKCAVEAAMEKSCVVGLAGTKIHGVRRLSSGNVQVRAHSSDQATLLLERSEEWVPHVLAGASVARKHFMLTAASVPTAFDPTAPDAREVLRCENPNAIMRAESVLNMRWVHGRDSTSISARPPSLVLTVADADTADHLIAHLCLWGSLPRAQACSDAANSRPPTCARCAGPHALKDCSCPAKTKAFEQSVVTARLDNGSPYFNPTFKPFPSPPARATRAAALRDPSVAATPCLLADFNLHQPLWSGPHTPQRTQRSDAEPLLEILAEQQLLLALPEGTPTFQSDAHRSWSTFDLVFLSSSISERVTRCETEYGHRSDHRCVVTELDLEVPTSAIAEHATPTSKPGPYSKRWWTPELTALKHDARPLSNRAAKRTATQTAIDAARAANKENHKAIRQQKRHHWRTTEDTLASRLPALNLPDGSVARSCEEKRDALMAQFFPAPPPASLDDIADAEYEPQLPFEPFSEEEIAAALDGRSPYKAPGRSGIPNAALKECSLIIQHAFTNIVNRCLELRYHPSAWKFFTTTTLRKPGKPSYLVPKAYRPIALEDTSSKVVESVIARRLAAIAEQHDLLPPTHFGGRPGRTTTDAVLHLTQRIKDSWRKKHITSVLYLDVTSAFPSVNHARLLHNLRKRHVPEPLVLWIADFLRNCRTQLKFDDFIEEPLLADCGLPQSSPPSPILYLFYSADLLELLDPKDRARVLLGYIDDTALAVSSPDIATNIRILAQLLNWSHRHACRFDLGKFQLVHYTLGHTWSSDSAKYLGLILDRHLPRSEQVESATAKGMAAVLAVNRLSRPTFGLPHPYARQLFKAVQGRRATGSVGIARRIGKVQRVAALMITGAFKTTSTAFIDFDAALPPVELRLNEAVYGAASRLATLPPSHPSSPPSVVAPPGTLGSTVPTFTSSSTPFLTFDTWKLSMRPSSMGCQIAPSSCSSVSQRHSASSCAAEVRKFHDLCVAAHSSEDGAMGAAAVTLTKDGTYVSCRAYLGPTARRQQHDGALAALALGVQVIADSPRVTRASILVADRAAARALLSARAQPGQHLVRLFLQQVDALQRKRRSLRIRIVWAPGQQEDFTAGAMAQEDALLAAHGQSSDLPRSLEPLLDLPASRPALLKQFSAQTLADWKVLWESSAQGQRLVRHIDDSAPGGNGSKRYRGLSRQQCSILAQLRSSHVPLNSYLARIGAVDSPLCLACRTPETAEHFLLTCRRFMRERHEPRTAVGGTLSLRSTLGNGKAWSAVLDFVAATKRFGEAYDTPIHST
ncbi:reverse transcriptase (RNA-dependent DNA polymerase)-domain-containing protein [Ganoderma leucocontextum]|nr:reverse transcriptase (RNA-dependent DNA polymerase)-domain-containing protein [Ganoderma leucocontextum]